MVLRRPTRPLQRRWFGRCSNGPGLHFVGLDLENRSCKNKEKNRGWHYQPMKSSKSDFLAAIFCAGIVESWLLDGFLVNGLICIRRALVSEMKDQNCKCKIVNLHQLILSTHLCITLCLKAKHLEMQPLCPTWHPYDTGCPNSMDTLTPQLPWALQCTSGSGRHWQILSKSWILFGNLCNIYIYI